VQNLNSTLRGSFKKAITAEIQNQLDSYQDVKYEAECMHTTASNTSMHCIVCYILIWTWYIFTDLHASIKCILWQSSIALMTAPICNIIRYIASDIVSESNAYRTIVVLATRTRCHACSLNNFFATNNNTESISSYFAINKLFVIF